MEQNVLSKINYLISSHGFKIKIRNYKSRKDAEEKLKSICTVIGCDFVELNAFNLVIMCDSTEIDLDIEELDLKISADYHEEWCGEGFDPFLSKLR